MKALRFLAATLILLSLATCAAADAASVQTADLLGPLEESLKEYTLVGDEEQTIDDIEFIHLLGADEEARTVEGVFRFTCMPYGQQYISDFTATYADGGQGVEITEISFDNLGAFVSYDALQTKYEFVKK